MGSEIAQVENKTKSPAEMGLEPQQGMVTRSYVQGSQTGAVPHRGAERQGPSGCEGKLGVAPGKEQAAGVRAAPPGLPDLL